MPPVSARVAPAPAGHRLAAALGGLKGWRRFAAAALCGLFAAAALPPLYLLPLLWPAFAGLLWLLDGVERPRQAFAIGWAFGTAHFLGGLYWVGIAFFVDAQRFGLFAPVAVLALAAGLGLFPGLALLGVQLTRLRGLARILLFAAAWLLVEWVRSWLFGGFPWNLIGTVWVFSDAMIQLAAAGGVWALSWLTVVAAAAPALLGESKKPPRPRLYVAALLALGLPALVWAGGALRLQAAPAPGSETVPDVTLRLVQPSIEQSLKWRADLRQKHVGDQMDLSVGPGFDKITHVIWAETAVPFNLTAEPELRRALGQIVPRGGALITGAPRAVDEGRDRRLWNSLHALDREGRLVASYDKVNLVPFGEFVPLRRWLGFAKLTVGGVDFSAGPGRRTLELSGLPPFSPLICYEVIFPSRVIDKVRPPQWLLSVTNDSWFGISSGPFQHFANARLRAVEEGLPLVRVANNGISGVVDPYGRVLDRLGLNDVGVIDTPLPKPLDSRTWFAGLGDRVLALLVVVSLAGALVSRKI